MHNNTIRDVIAKWSNDNGLQDVVHIELLESLARQIEEREIDNE